MTLPVNKIICGDCLEILKDFPDDCVDLVLTDPPYGRRITKKDNQFGNAIHKSYKATMDSWDDKPPTRQGFEVIVAKSANSIIFGGNYFELPVSEKWLVWDKVGNFNFNNPFSDCELIWTSYTGVIQKYIVIQQGYVRDEKEPRVHPCQKPILLMVKILQDFSKPNDLILDPFCGSGTTCVAAKMLGRRYIGIDISEEYCEIARQRIRAVDTGVPVKEQRKGQMALFGDK